MKTAPANEAYIVYLEREVSSLRGQLRYNESLAAQMQESSARRCGELLDQLAELRESLEFYRRSHAQSERGRVYWKGRMEAVQKLEEGGTVWCPCGQVMQAPRAVCLRCDSRKGKRHEAAARRARDQAQEGRHGESAGSEHASDARAEEVVQGSLQGDGSGGNG